MKNGLVQLIRWESPLGKRGKYMPDHLCVMEQMVIGLRFVILATNLVDSISVAFIRSLFNPAMLTIVSFIVFKVQQHEG